MPAESMRQRIIAALKARAEAITIENGFHTDAGLKVTHGYRRPGAGETDARIAMLSNGPLPPVPSEEQDDVIVRRQWSIGFIAMEPVSAEVDDALDVAEELLADLKRALFLDDRTLGGLLRANEEVGNIEIGAEQTADREPGGTWVEAAVEVLVTFTERRGQPESR